MTKYYLILEKTLVKGEPDGFLPGIVQNTFAFENGAWKKMDSSEINDRLLGYDPTEEPGWCFGNRDIMEEIREITEAEALGMIASRKEKS